MDGPTEDQIGWAQRFTGLRLSMSAGQSNGTPPPAGADRAKQQSGNGQNSAAPGAPGSPPDDDGSFVDNLNGVGAGFARTRGASPGNPGNGAVTPEIAAKLLENLANKRPPFRPDLGQVGPVSWFVTGGDPHVGAGADKTVAIPVEVGNPTGKPPLRFDQAELDKIYEAKMPAARDLVEKQVREKTGKTKGESLNRAERQMIDRSAAKVAERQMWTEVGNRTAASESGVGVVELKNSRFSQKGDGEFTLTSRPDAVKIQGGTEALLKIVTEHGAPAEPEVLEAAEKLAQSEKWGGRVQGAFRVGGKILIVVGIALDAYKIYTATDKAKAVAEVAGGWTAATLAGTAFAEAFAPADAAGPIAWAVHGVGTLVVGGVAYFIGSKGAKTIYELTIEGDPVAISGH